MLPLYYLSSEVRHAASIARSEGFELDRENGAWVLRQADDGALYTGQTVSRANRPAVGTFKSLAQVGYYCQQRGWQ